MDGDLAVGAKDPAGDGHIEHLGGDEETHHPSTSPRNFGGEARPVEHADVIERQDRRPRERNVVDARHANPEQRPFDRHHEGDAEPPPDVQIALRGTRCVDGLGHASNTTTERITSPASMARNASSRSIETDLPADHAVEVESPVERPTGHLGEVLRGDRIATVGDEQRRLPWVGGMLGAVPRQGDLRGDRRHPDRHGDSGVVEHRHRLGHHLWNARGFEREVDAVAPRELANRRDGVDGRCIDRVGRPEPTRPFQLRRGDVDGDQPLGAGDPRALQRREADPAEADHRDAGAGPHLRRLGRRADAGGDAASEQTSAPQRQFRRHRDRLRGMHDGVRGERSERERPRERRGVPRPADARRLRPRM